MPVYACPRCNGPITDVAGELKCPNSPCQYGHDEPRGLVPQADPIKVFYAAADDFDSFWKAYPRKTGKAAAKKAWAKLKPTVETMRLIFKALDWQCGSKQWAEDGIIPHASTWLNGRRWEDEPPTALVPANPTPPKPPLKSFAMQGRENAANLRRAGVQRPGMPTSQPPRPGTLPLPEHAGSES